MAQMARGGFSLEASSASDCAGSAPSAASAETVHDFDDATFNRLSERFAYVYGDYDDDGTFERLAKAVGDAAQPVFYLEIPPSLFAEVIGKLAAVGLTNSARVVIEKPF